MGKPSPIDEFFISYLKANGDKVLTQHCKDTKKTFDKAAILKVWN